MSTENKSVNLPSRYTINEVVGLKFRRDQVPMDCTVRGVHFFEGKVKYDLEIWLEDDLNTRIYNVDSAFVSTDTPKPK